MSSDYHVHSDGQPDSVALEAADLVVMCKKYTTGWDEWRLIAIFLCRKVTSPELPCNCSGAQRSSNQAVAHAEGRCAGEVRSQPKRGEQHASSDDVAKLCSLTAALSASTFFLAYRQSTSPWAHASSLRPPRSSAQFSPIAAFCCRS